MAHSARRVLACQLLWQIHNAYSLCSAFHNVNTINAVDAPQSTLKRIRGGCGLSLKTEHDKSTIADAIGLRKINSSPQPNNAPHNFGAASSRDDLVYGSFRPAFSEETEKAGSVEDADVAVWASFMRENGIQRVICLLNDEELKFYKSVSSAPVFFRQCQPART